MADKSKFWNDAGKAGLVLAAVAVVYYVLNVLLSKWEGGGFLANLVTFILWGCKFALCILLMVRFLKSFAKDNEFVRRSTFRYGMAIAACSALVYSAFTLFYALVIDPDLYAETFNMMGQTYSSILTSEQLDQIMNMESSMPTIAFFTNLIWCWLVGTVISAIASSRICLPDNPFDE